MPRIENKETAKDTTFKLLKEAEEKRAAQRFERGLLELENGRFSVLNNNEFVERLISYLYAQFSEHNADNAKKIIDSLFKQLSEKENEEGVARLLGAINLRCLQGSNISLMQYLCLSYSALLAGKKDSTYISEDLCEFFVNAGEFFVRSSLWKDFQNLIDFLWKIKNITYSTKNDKNVQVKTVFYRMATKDVVEKILHYHIKGDSEKKALASRAIQYFGEDAVLYLLNRLVFSKDKTERFLLIKLIGSFGEEIVSIMHKFMEEDLPWYAIRNLIMLVAEIGNPNYYPMVEGYLVHPDVRVQQQVVSCIVKLGGSQQQKRLIQALPVIDDEIKAKLVMQLGAYNDEEIANGLIDLLHKREKLHEGIRENLVYKICITLRSYPYTNVTNVLKYLLKERKNNSNADMKTTIAIKETINILEPQIRHLVKGERSSLENLEYTLDDDKIVSGPAGIDDFVENIDMMLQEGELEKATALMYKRIIDLARTKDFHSAEMLRDKLLEVNPDALQDVIRAAEIIEEEKSTPNTSFKIDIWDNLFNKLSSAEYEALLNCFQNENYKKDEKIVSSGEIDSCLYFINAGAVRLSFNSGRQETFLKRLKAGDVIGLGPFFSASVWTVNLTTLQRTQLQVIKRDDFLKISKLHPDLEEKLLEFVKRKETIEDLIKISGRDRRDYARYPVNVTVNNVLLDPYGASEGRRTFQGEMLDISRGGLSFSIRISKKESANLLLGRQIISEIHLKGNDILKCFGLIVGVRYQHEIVKEFSVHVKFYKELEQLRVTEVLNLVI